MRTLHIALFSLAYIVPLALCVYLLATHTKRRRQTTTGVLLLLPIFYFIHYLLLYSLPGWPSDEALPDRFQLIAYHVDEPLPASRNSGEILLWIKQSPDKAPRVHRLAYDRDLHQSLDDTGRDLAAGVKLIGARRAAPNTGSAANNIDSTQFVFEQEPPLRLPEKAPAQH